MAGDHPHAHTLEPDALAIDGALDELRELTAELQASRTRIVEAGDAARRRIERDLHDGAQQRFVTASMLLGSVIRAVGRGEHEHLAETLDHIRAELDAGLAELRDLAHGIHPAILSDLGLRPAVDALVSRSTVPVRIDGGLDGRPVPSVEATLYFVIAEALTNVAKYAHASEAVVTITQVDGHAEVRIRDDGAGGADPANGSGLRGLVDRLGALGGHLHVDSRPGGGTVVHATVPLDPHRHTGEPVCGCCAEGQCRCAP